MNTVIDWFNDPRFWLGLVGTVTGVTSLILGLSRERRAARTEARLEVAEERARFGEGISRRAAHILRVCESSAAEAEEVGEDHPEWTNRAQSLHIGRGLGENCAVTYVRLVAQSHATDQIQFSVCLNKWYIHLPSGLTDVDTMAIFGELQKLLARPGVTEFGVDNSIPDWVRESSVGQYVGLKFTDFQKIN